MMSNPEGMRVFEGGKAKTYVFSMITAPTTSVWFKWKISFSDYIYLLSDINPSTSLSEPAKLRLLRHNLGEEDQNYFDALNLRAKSSLEDALASHDRSWGLRTNMLTAVFEIMHMR